ncbi:MAG TPA: hypothetical protein PLU17_03235 [Chitinophagaceae bacterium]|jgi:hypothetical protein|nr:hypothetical protein [Chitinophagaceae bacterium]
MKKILLFLIIISTQFIGRAQEIKGETITVLKGGITVIRFNADIVNFRLGDKEDYNINVEEGTSIRLWAKTGVTDPKTTNLVVTEGKRNHLFTIQYKEKGDFNSTYYDFSNLKELKKKLSSKPVVKEESVTEIVEEKVEEEKPIASNDKKKETESKSAKKAREEKEKQLAKEQKEREELEANIASEKQKQADLEKQIASEKQERAEKLASDKKVREAKELKLAKELKEKEESERLALLEKKKQEELDKKIASEKKLKDETAAKLEKERKLREEKEKKLIEDRIAKQEHDLALANTQKEQNELNAKLAAEKKQRESLELKLAQERAKRDANEKALALETQKREQKEAALAKERQVSEAREQKLALEKKKREDADRKILEERKKREEQEQIAKEERERYVPPPPTIDIRKKFPTINFNEPPEGQYFDGQYYADTTAYYKAAQVYLVQKEDAKFKNAGTEMDGIRIQLCNINFSGNAAYIRFKIENKTSNYFILGATMLKVLEAESGKKYQLNPYYLSSFPIIDANSSDYIVYVMKPQQNISPDSFVMMSIRERQTSKKFELNFPGNFYTDALKAVEK